MHVYAARALAVAGALALTGAAAHAQAGLNPFSFGVSAGASIPTGAAGDDWDTGYNVDALLEVRAPAFPIGLRFEGGYQQFKVTGESDDVRVISGIANAVLRFTPATVTLRPYLIGGVGAYNLKPTGVDGRTEVGLNGGVGLEIPLTGITGFAEARYHSIFTDPSNITIVPIKFGIRF